MTTVLLQRAGTRVTIYAKDLPPNVRSAFATGLYTPDSRICLEEHATPAFKQNWAQMARQSFHTYVTFLGLPGTSTERALSDLRAGFVTRSPAQHLLGRNGHDRPRPHRA
jgi:hypothetical protein